MKSNKDARGTILEDVERIVDSLTDLNEKVVLDDSGTYLSQSDYDILMKQVATLNYNIFNHKEVSNKSRDRLDKLTHIMTCMASMDFSNKAETDGSDNHLDYMATGLNLMSYQLNKALTPIKAFVEAFDQLPEAIFVLNKDFKIQSINKMATKLLGYTLDHLKGKHIDSLFNVCISESLESIEKVSDPNSAEYVELTLKGNNQKELRGRIATNVSRDDLLVPQGYVVKVSEVQQLDKKLTPEEMTKLKALVTQDSVIGDNKVLKDKVDGLLRSFASELLKEAGGQTNSPQEKEQIMAEIQDMLEKE